MPQVESIPKRYLVEKANYSQDMLIRLIEENDSNAILQIYNHEVQASAATFDLVTRKPEEQRIWMTEHSGVFSALVAELGNEIVGFASLSPYKNRAAYNTTVENSVYTKSEFRGQGIADALLQELISVARSNGFHTMIARIGGANEASIALHNKNGFTTVGIEREVGRKFGQWQDVVIMQILIDRT